MGGADDENPAFGGRLLITVLGKRGMTSKVRRMYVNVCEEIDYSTTHGNNTTLRSIRLFPAHADGGLKW